MPSFAVNNVLGTYLQHTHASEFEEGREPITLLHQVINSELRRLDGYFSEAEALNIAAGTYFTGMKKTSAASTCIPKAILDVWTEDEDLSRRFPDPVNITRADNILLWAKQEGRILYPEIDSYLSGIIPFNKRDPGAPWDRSIFNTFPVIDPVFNENPVNTGRSGPAESGPVGNETPYKAKPILKRALDTLVREGPISFGKKLLRRLVQNLE
jgi:hypothetical protein